MRYYLAVDIGASSGRHILAHVENEKLILEEIYRFENGPKRRTVNGEEHLFWDTEYLFAEILSGLRRAKEIGKIPYSIGIDTWGVDYALLDENDKLIESVYCYRDARTEKTVPMVHEIVPAAELFSKTGIAYASFNTVYQLYDDKLTGKLDKAKSFLMLPDYFHFLLTGNKLQEYTMATTTSMLSATTHTWDTEILDKLGYNSELFRAPTQPSAKVGELKEKIQKLVGYNAVVTLPATHDTASAVLAAPLSDGAPYISSGTWSLLGIEQSYAHTDIKSMKTGYSNEGGLNYSFRLQKNIMGLWILQQVRHELEDKYSFVELAEMARNNQVPDKIDVNDSRFLAPKSMTRELFSAVGRELSVGECAYLILNNLAMSYKESLDDLENVTGKYYDTLHIFGGGCKNLLLNELTEKYTEKRVIAGPVESTALGNLLLQMIGSGDLSDICEGRTLVQKSFDIK